MRILGQTALATILCTGSAWSPATAEPLPQPPDTTSVSDPTPAPCETQTLTAIRRVGCQLAQQLQFPGGHPTPRYVVASHSVMVTSQKGRPKEKLLSTLTRRIATGIASELPGQPQALGPMSLKQAFSESHAPVVVYLRPKIQGGQLQVEAELYRASQSFWHRLIGASRVPLSRGVSAAPIDAEIASFFPPIPLVATQLMKIKAPIPTAVALACGDMDGIPGAELLVVGRHSLHQGKIRSRAFLESAQAEWGELSPVAPTPLRDPIATAEILPAGGAVVGLTDRAEALWLNSRLEPVGRAPAAVPWPGGGCSTRELLGVSRRVMTCPELPNQGTEGALPPRLLGADGQKALWANAVGGALLATPSGDAFRVRGIRTGEGARSGVTLWRHPKREGHSEASSGGDGTPLAPAEATVSEPAGYAFALGDLNLDGSPDFLTSSATLEPSEDTLTLFTWGEDGLEQRAELPAPGGVTAIAFCPPEDPQVRSTWVASVGDELWIGK